MEELLTPHPLPPLADSGLDLKLGGGDLGSKLHYTLCFLTDEVQDQALKVGGGWWKR